MQPALEPQHWLSGQTQMNWPLEQALDGAASGAAKAAGAAKALLERMATTATAMNERRAIAFLCDVDTDSKRSCWMGFWYSRKLTD